MNRRAAGSIMVAVRALDRSSGRLLRKAAALAKEHGSELELVHVLPLPYSAAANRRASLRGAAQEILADCERRLRRLAASPSLRGISTRATVVWDHPLAEALVRHALRRRPRMLLAESQRHTRLARAFLGNTDWELIRKCPCPLWLSRSAAWRGKRVVLAALDPLHAHAKPAALDTLILRQALSAAGGRPARVFACHAYTFPAPPVIDGAVEAYWAGMSDEEVRRYRSMLERQLRRLARAQRIAPGNILVSRGEPALVLPRIARELRASVVVMGAASRSALARVLIGHTAERVIDALDCDVLIVKPRGFKPAVEKPSRRAPFVTPADLHGVMSV